jgi:glycerol-3-phosphate dehydrogenase
LVLPIISQQEINFLLDTVNQYTIRKLTVADIKASFCGQRPLVSRKGITASASGNNSRNNSTPKSSKISRKHEIFFEDSGLISIVGGKWTIYRRMGEDTINFAIKHGLLKWMQPSITKELILAGAITKNGRKDDDNRIPYPLEVYGSDYAIINKIQEETGDYDKLHPALPYFNAEVIYHVRHEMARTVEDVLARRTRALFLDIAASIAVAPKVARMMATELGYPNSWVDEQLSKFYANHK